MLGFQGTKLYFSIILLSCLIIFGCSDAKVEQKEMNNFEKHFSELYDTEHVSVTFERRKNQTENEAWPDSFDCAVVKIIDSDYLGEAIDDEELFRTEYDEIKNFLRDSAQTINPKIFGLALTVIDTIDTDQNESGPLATGIKLTKSKSIESSLVLENDISY